MPYLEIEIDDGEVQQRFNYVISSLVYSRTLMGEIGDLLMDSVQQHFDGETDGDTTWRPPQTPQDHPLLDDTGRLRGSIRSSASDEDVIVGTNLYYGVYQQEGTSDIPSRPFLNIDSIDVREIEDTVSDYLDREDTLPRYVRSVM